MGSKSVLFVGLFLAMTVLISSQIVAAAWNDINQREPPDSNKPPPTGGVCKHGCCGRSSHTGGCICCTRPGQQPSTPDFPAKTPIIFNFTQGYKPKNVAPAHFETAVYMLDYNSEVEMVFQGTNYGVGCNIPNI